MVLDAIRGVCEMAIALDDEKATDEIHQSSFARVPGAEGKLAGGSGGSERLTWE